MDPEESGDKILAQLTAADAPFELDQIEINGETTTIFRNACKNLPELLNTGREHGDSIYMVYQGDQWSFDRFYAAVDAMVAWMRSEGVKPGDRVSIAMRNRPEWAVMFTAAALAGAIPAPLNSFGSRDELRSVIADVRPTLLCCDSDRLARMENDPGIADCSILRVGPETSGTPAVTVTDYETAVQTAPDRSLEVDPEPDDPALILFTAGTSGNPKGVVSTHRAVCQSITNIEFVGAYSAMASPELVQKMMASGDAPTTLTVVPLFHVSGLHAQLLSTLKSGRTLVFMYRWDPHEALKIMREQKVTQFNGAPAMVRQFMAEEGFSDPEIRNRLMAVGFGGAGIPEGLIEQTLEELPDQMTGTGFGMTETNGVGSAFSGDLFEANPKSSGLVSPLMDVRIADENDQPLAVGEVGEILFRGVPVMTQYWDNSEATAEALAGGWMHTGDMGYLDESGYLYVIDRLKDIINRSGENIAAGEVESCLQYHEAVLEAAVFAVPDSKTHEAVAAVVCVDAEQDQPTSEDLKQHVAESLAGYKIPRDIDVRLEPLTRNPSGKLIKPEIKKEFFERFQ